jgi:hypothetical protein
MNAVNRVLRGPAASGVLVRFGVDPKRYWLLVDLFAAMSERQEVMDQLGRNNAAMGMAGIIYVIISASMTILSVVAHATPAAHLALFLTFTVFLFTGILLSEAGNSLVNPTEGMVLAHQPINGATYTAAKLSHLLRIILFLTPALNGMPAIGGLALPKAHWYYPFLHLAAAFTVTTVVALACCATFGWLMRFIPPKRLQGVGQFVGAVPLAAMAWMNQLPRLFAKLPWRAIVPASPMARYAVVAAFIAAAISAVVFGLRSLSADYLVRVSAMTRGGASGGAHSRRSLGASIVGRLSGPAGRAGYAFSSRLMLRDWQFRRQFLATAMPLAMGIGYAYVKGWNADPFAETFSPIHFLPHAFGLMLLFVCALLPFGSDYKGAWIFRLAPPPAFDGFAAGVYGMLAQIVIVLHVLAAPLLIWKCGPLHAGLFLAFSLATGAVYIAATMRLTDGIPFTRQPDPKRSAIGLPVLTMGMAVVGVAVALQHFVLFRSLVAVGVTTVILAVAGWFAGRASVAAMGADMKSQVAQEVGESGTLYLEVEA